MIDNNVVITALNDLLSLGNYESQYAKGFVDAYLTIVRKQGKEEGKENNATTDKSTKK